MDIIYPIGNSPLFNDMAADSPRRGMVFFKMNAYTPGSFCGLDNFRKVVTHTQFLPTLWNTVKYVLWSLVLGYLPPVILAVIVNEMVHFKSGFRVTIYLPMIIGNRGDAYVVLYLLPRRNGTLEYAFK